MSGIVAALAIASTINPIAVIGGICEVVYLTGQVVGVTVAVVSNPGILIGGTAGILVLESIKRKKEYDQFMKEKEEKEKNKKK